jgi:hypothetical protein
VNREPQWAVSPLDTMTYLLPPLGGSALLGVYRACCGRLLPSCVVASSSHPTGITAQGAR